MLHRHRPRDRSPDSHPLHTGSPGTDDDASGLRPSLNGRCWLDHLAPIAWCTNLLRSWGAGPALCILLGLPAVVSLAGVVRCLCCDGVLHDVCTLMSTRFVYFSWLRCVFFGRAELQTKKNHPKVAAVARCGLLAPKLGQRVLKRLDQALHILRRHLDPVG